MKAQEKHVVDEMVFGARRFEALSSQQKEKKEEKKRKRNTY